VSPSSKSRRQNVTLSICYQRAKPDAGGSLDEKTIDRLFPCACQSDDGTWTNPTASRSVELEAMARKSRIHEAEDASAAFLLAETDKLDAYADDLEKAADAEIKATEDEIKAAKKGRSSNTVLSVNDKVEEQRAIKKARGASRRIAVGEV